MNWVNPYKPNEHTSKTVRMSEGISVNVSEISEHNCNVPAICFMRVMRTPSAPMTPLFTSSLTNHTSCAQRQKNRVKHHDLGQFWTTHHHILRPVSMRTCVRHTSCSLRNFSMRIWLILIRTTFMPSRLTSVRSL